MSRSAGFTLAVFCAALLGSCNGENGQAGFSGGEITPEKLPETYAGIICAAIDRCCSPPDTFKDACHENIVESMSEELESLESGRSTFDSAAATTCAAAFQTGFADCVFSPEEAPESCDKVFVGTGQEGAPCEAAYQCANGLECFLGSSAGEGRCTGFAGEGESCSEKQCMPEKGLTCVQQPMGPLPPPGSGPVPVPDRICSKAAALGEPCESIHCGEELYCDRSVSPPTCAAQGAVGAACESHDQCLSITCSNEKCVAEGSICSAFGVDADAPPRGMFRRLPSIFR